MFAPQYLFLEVIRAFWPVCEPDLTQLCLSHN